MIYLTTCIDCGCIVSSDVKHRTNCFRCDSVNTIKCTEPFDINECRRCIVRFKCYTGKPNVVECTYPNYTLRYTNNETVYDTKI